MAKEQQNAAPDTAAPAKPTAPSKKKKEFKKKKERRTVPHGLVHVSASFNNTQITITDPDGRVLCNSSAGAIGFKGSRKGTPYAAQQASLSAASSARDQFGMKSVEVRVKGPGSGRESAVRALAAAGLHIVVDGAPRIIEADTSVICAGQTSNRELFDDQTVVVMKVK